MSAHLASVVITGVDCHAQVVRADLPWPQHSVLDAKKDSLLLFSLFFIAITEHPRLGNCGDWSHTPTVESLPCLTCMRQRLSGWEVPCGV